MEPLNPRLYAALENYFGEVRIANEGEQARFGQGGEHYYVNCPYCADGRQRLSFSYLWSGLDCDDPYAEIHRVHCFNEDCVNNSGRQNDLVGKLLCNLPVVKEAREKLKHPKPQSAITSDGQAERVITLPAGCIPVDQLPADHPAVQYLQDRGFDVNELSQKWEVSYCEYDGMCKPMIFTRIVIPYYRRKLLVPKTDPNPVQKTLAGWTARSIAAIERGPKYLTCAGMKKSQMLYGIVNALQSPIQEFVAVCEGTTDVWRAPFPAVALIGKTMSETQKDLLIQNFKNRVILVMVDSDAKTEAAEICQELQQARQATGDEASALVVDLPADKKDPAECTADELWQAVQDALENAASLN